MAGDKHKELILTAIYWLHKRGCSVFANEVPTCNGIADALGVITRPGDERVYYIETKVSRSDLICRKQKDCYEKSMRPKGYHYSNWRTMDMDIDYYYLIVADGVKVEPEIYPNWGVINEEGTVIRKAKRMRETAEIKQHVESIAHVLVYKHFGKLYQ